MVVGSVKPSKACPYTTKKSLNFWICFSCRIRMYGTLDNALVALWSISSLRGLLDNQFNTFSETPSSSSTSAKLFSVKLESCIADLANSSESRDRTDTNADSSTSSATSFSSVSSFTLMSTASKAMPEDLASSIKALCFSTTWADAADLGTLSELNI